MTVTKRWITSLLIALGILAGLMFLVRPAGGAAQALTFRPELRPAREPAAQIGEQAIVLPGPDFRISVGNSARSPEIAANDEFAALVYVQNNRVWLRSAQKGSGWGIQTLLSNNGELPKLAFNASSTNTLYVVWAETRTIQFRRCTLVDPTNFCSNPVSSGALTSAPVDDQLQTPDIAVGGNRIFVAWVDRQGPGSTDNLIRLASSTNNGQTWPQGSTVALVAGDNAGLPALAATNTQVHLAYKDNSAPWTIQYRRFPLTLGAPNVIENFTSGADTNSSYGAMNNPVIAVNGANIYLLWDNKHSSPTFYGLTGAQSSNSGATWAIAKHIPSQTAATNDTDQKKSKDSGPPSEEATLLPSVTISATTFAAVWQQRPQELCQDVGGNPLNDTSEIYFTPNVNNPAGSGTLANSRIDYAIDPDLAVDTNGTHVAFMKDDSVPNCGAGGETSEYGVFYRGPFTSESNKIKKISLPLLEVN